MESEDIFKYQRLKGKLGSTIKSETITATCLDENSIVLGTARGHIYVFGMNCKLVKSYQAHAGSVNDLAIDPHELTIYSCSECGTVVMNSLGLGGEDMELLYTAVDKTPLRAICVEDVPMKRKDKAFIVGAESGQIIYRRNTWATSVSHRSQKELFRGSGSCVSTVSWRGAVVAWADASHLRLMEVTSQTAICYLSCPPNIGVNNPFPCSLFWDTNMDLLIGWGDSFRQLHLVQTGPQGQTSSQGGNGGNGQMLRAKLTADWVADSIICSMSSFDKEHALILGYVPPSEDMFDDSLDQNDDDDHRKACIELLCVQKKDGRILSADLLPLQTEADGSKRCAGNSDVLFDSYAPENFRMLSSYTCLVHRTDAAQWSYKTPFQRGGYRNLPPRLFIMTPNDLVTVKVCDVNDRISHALQNGNIRQAVYLAKKDKYNLRLFTYKDLVSKYLNSLLDDDQAEVAAFECSQLLTEVQDGSVGGSLDQLWQEWIQEFACRRRLSAIAPHVPTGENGYYHAPSPSPQEGGAVARVACRLPLETYALFLHHFLTANSRAFLQVIQQWGVVSPRLFDAAEWLEKLRVHMSDVQDSRQSRAGFTGTVSGASALASTPGRNDRRGGKKAASYRSHGSGLDEEDEDDDDVDAYANADPRLLEAKAHLHSYLGQYRKAIQCYLAIEPSSCHGLLENEFAVGQNRTILDASKDKDMTTVNNYQHVFDLIEKKKLFEEVQHHVLRLVQFSRTLAEGLLIRNMDQLPVYTVVQQLKSDPVLLHWYLHILFTKAPDVYNTQEYSEFHLTQVALYAHFAPKFDPASLHTSSSNNGTGTGTGTSTVGVKNQNGHVKPLIILPGAVDDDGDSYLHSMHQIEEQSDFLKFLKYSNFVPLEVALRECERQSPPLYREIVFILAKMGCVKEGLLLLLRELGDVQLAVKYIELYGPEHWDLIVDHALSHHAFLGELLDLIGCYNRFDPMTLVGKLPPCMEIPGLRQRLSRLLSHCSFQNFLRGRCLHVLQEDTLSELKQLNRAQRKAIKVLPSAARCVACGRPTSMLPPSHSSFSGPSSGTPALSSVSGPTAVSDFNQAGESGFAGAASRLQGRGVEQSSRGHALDRGRSMDAGSGGGSGGSSDNIWGLPLSTSATSKESKNVSSVSSRTIPVKAHVHDAVVFFPNKVAYHISCFYLAQESQL